MDKEDYFKYYIQGSDHYLIPKDVFKELFNEMINWREESQKQKEVIDKIFNYLEDKYGYNLTKGTINDTDIDELYKILEEVSE